MKKLIITVGLLLVAAVFMSGCVTETEDPIVGIWHNGQTIKTVEGFELSSEQYIFNADGTGFSLIQFTGEVVYAQVDFSWKNNGDGKYTITRLDVLGNDLPETEEFTLEGEELIKILPDQAEMPVAPNEEAWISLMEATVFHKEPVAEYLVGLWATDVYDYKELIDIVSLVYISEDGTGNIIVYSSDVMGIDDVYTTKFTWEEKDGVMYCVEEGGEEFKLTLKNGVLYEGKEEVLHKYVVEDRLLGIWMSDEPSKEAEGTFDIVILIRPDGTGVEIWTAPGSHVAAAKYYFTWEMTGPTTYQAVYDDGEVWDFATVKLGLTDGEVTYSKVGYDVLAEYAQKVTA